MSIEASMRWGLLDHPNARSSHTAAVPRIGGIGILCGFLICAAMIWLLVGYGAVKETISIRQFLPMVLGGTGMAMTGLYDDLFQVKPSSKYILQFLCAVLVLVLGVRLQSLSAAPWGFMPMGILAIPATLLWLTGFPNIYNFMDGINGLAAGTGVAYGIFLFFMARWQGNTDIQVMAILLAASSAGFMVHNFPQARTFMGDTGSLFLGEGIAVIVIQLSQVAPHRVPMEALILVCSVFLYDSGFTLVRRMFHGENIFQPHRSHLYQRLVRAGLSHVKVTLLYLTLHIVMGLLALDYLVASSAGRLWILGTAAALLLAFTLAVYRLEVGRMDRAQKAANAVDSES